MDALCQYGFVSLGVLFEPSLDQRPGLMIPVEVAVLVGSGAQPDEKLLVGGRLTQLIEGAHKQSTNRVGTQRLGTVFIENFRSCAEPF
ncbi:hypothetical protein D3C85_1490700 [compost metagenome]